jgi:hypothetical protein
MSSSCESIPVLYIKANNNYDVGYKIGQTFKHFIRDHLTSETAKSLWSFYESKDGRKKYADSLEATRKSYPNIIEEIQGMADGSDVSFEKLFLQDMVSEILLHYSHVSKDVDNTDREVAGCTDVMVNTESCRLIGHNEDWSPEVRDGMFMVNVDLDKGTPSETVKGNKEVNNVLASRNERYLANMFPGFLAGNTFYVNETFAVSVNSLVPVSVNEGAVPVDILLRALIGCVTIEECVTVMKNEPVGCSFGINLNIASRQSANMWSLEVYPDYVCNFWITFMLLLNKLFCMACCRHPYIRIILDQCIPHYIHVFVLLRFCICLILDLTSHFHYSCIYYILFIYSG